MVIVRFAALELLGVPREPEDLVVAKAILGTDCKSTKLEVQNWRNWEL